MSGIKFAESILVEEYEEEINELLELIGHPEALVTDRSMLWDFWGPREEAKEKIHKLSARLGFKVYYNTYLVDIAIEMKKRAQIFYKRESEFIPIGDCIGTCLDCLGGDQEIGCVCGKQNISMCYHDIQKAKKERK